MNRKLLLFLLLIPKILSAQLYEDFGKSNNPHKIKWLGTSEAFAITEDLSLRSKTINTTYLSTSNSLANNAQWEIGIQLDFNPSNQNQLRIYLISNQDTLKNALEGYFILIGETGNTDRYHLYKQKGDAISLIMSSPPKTRLDANQVKSRVRVNRDSKGTWQLYTALDNKDFILDGTAKDNEFMTSSHFGIHCLFTSGNSDKFQFDYFKIQTLGGEEIPEIPTEETSLPKVISNRVINNSSIEIEFNKKLDNSSAVKLANYKLDLGYGSPNKATLKDSKVTISFADTLLTNNYKLQIKAILDLFGNNLADTLITFSYKAPENTQPEPPGPETSKLKPNSTVDLLFHDEFKNDLSLWSGEVGKFLIESEVLINQASAKSPSFVRFPNIHTRNHLWEAGFEINGALSSQNNIRLYLTAVNDSLAGNQKGYYLQIDGTAGNHTYKLYRQNNTSATLLFLSKSIPNQNNGLRARVRITCTIDGEWKIFADEYDQGEFIQLSDINDKTSVIDLTYDISLYSGWMTRFSSTRVKDYALHYFIIKELDNIPMSILNMEFINLKELKVTFNKAFDQNTALSNVLYRINNGMGNPTTVNIFDPTTLILSYSDEFIMGNHYKLEITNLSDLTGVKSDLSEEIYMPESIGTKDIIINEILPDPFKDGVEFVEIYNNSTKTLDLNSLSLGTIRESDGRVSLRKITEESHLMLPGTYRLLSPNSAIVESQYPGSSSENFIQMPSFSQLVNASGTVVLMDGETEIDRFDYHKDMHDDLIKDPKGVSLERINFNAPTNSIGNFKSAASTVGYATPGYKNSHQDGSNNQGIQFSLSSKTFSPDDDGYEDRLEINYNVSNEEEVMASIEIYNNKGKLIKTLNKNRSLANSGTLNWDGQTDTNQRAHVGIYIVLIELYNTKGMRKVIKKSFVLASKF